MIEVQDKSPQSFDKILIFLKCFNGDLNSNNVTFQRSSFWIHIFNVPIKSINKTIGTRIANKIGNPLMVDAPKSGLVWGPFLRIKDDNDITKPLMKGKMVHIANVEEGWFSNMRN